MGYGHILVPELLALPPKGMINVHPSLLPELRGAAPVEWAILRGLESTGVTIMQMEAGMDSGPILHQIPHGIPADVTGGELSLHLSEVGAQALIETLLMLENDALRPVPQDHTKATFAPKLTRELARIAKSAFAMRVLACKRDPSRRDDAGYSAPGTGDPEGRLPDGWFAPDKLHDLLAQSDVVVMAAPLTAQTQRLLGRDELAAMKHTAYFINVGRGATVDEPALAAALRERRLAGAAIDVFATEPPPAGHPFYSLDNAIVSPHVSGFLPSYDDRCVELFAENLRRCLAGTPLLNLVDRERGY